MRGGAWRLAAVVSVVGTVVVTGADVAPVHGVDTPLTISTTSIDFGDVGVGQTSDEVEVTLTNTGGVDFGPVQGFGGGFASTDIWASAQNCQGQTLAANGGTCKFFYKFKPQHLGPASLQTSFIISESDEQSGEEFDIDLAGNGINPITAAPLTHDFGDVVVGNTSSTHSTIITNTSSQPFGPLSIFGGGVSSPWANAQNCQGATLAANGGTCQVDYTFSPTVPAPVALTTGFLVGATDLQADATPFTIQLLGCGVTQRAACTTLTVNKHVPQSAPTPWSFDMTISPDPQDGLHSATQAVTDESPTAVWGNLQPGTQYTITESNLPAGWTGGTFTCQGVTAPNGGPARVAHQAPRGVEPVGPSSKFTPSSGDEVVCDITNLPPPVVTIQKVTTGGAGGPFQFDVRSGNAAVLYGSASISTSAANTPAPASPAVVAVSTGSVLVIEQPRTGFFFVSLHCVLFGTDGNPTGRTFDGSVVAGQMVALATDISAGQEVRCLAVNEKAATVVVTKTVLPATWPYPWSATFAISPVPAGETSPKVATESSATVQWGNLDPGVNYTITETTSAGLTKGSIVCSGVTPPQTPPGPARLPHGGGGPPPPGTASFTPYPANKIECAATNYAPPRVIVQKSTSGDTGGPFHIVVSNDHGQKPVKYFGSTDIVTTAQSPQPVPGVDFVVDPGWVLLEETAMPAHWVRYEWRCLVTDENGKIVGAPRSFEPAVGFELAVGWEMHCVVFNRKLASVSVTKTVDGPAPWSFDFTISPVPPGQPATKTATNLQPTVTWDDLAPDESYTVTETPDDDYLMGDLECSDGRSGPDRSTHAVPAGAGQKSPSDTFTPYDGQQVTCTAHNVAKGKIIVHKVVSGSTPSDTWAFKFTLNPGNVQRTATNQLPDAMFTGLDPSETYTITESGPFDPRYGLGSIVCPDSSGTAQNGVTVDVDPGETVECTATNTRTPSDVAVTKTPDVSTVTLGSTVVWTLNMINNGPGPAASVALLDPLPDELDLVSVTPTAGWDCSGSTFGNPGVVSCTKPSMAVGETASFAVVTTVNAGIGSDPIVNSVHVSTTTQETTLVNNDDAAEVVPEELPATGSDNGWSMGLGAAFLGAGLLLAGLGRRRIRAS